jgi:hypothetical protein
MPNMQRALMNQLVNSQRNQFTVRSDIRVAILVHLDKLLDGGPFDKGLEFVRKNGGVNLRTKVLVKGS